VKTKNEKVFPKVGELWKNVESKTVCLFIQVQKNVPMSFATCKVVLLDDYFGMGRIETWDFLLFLRFWRGL